MRVRLAPLTVTSILSCTSCLHVCSPTNLEKMLKMKKLWTPLSVILRRCSLPSTACLFPLNQFHSSVQIHSPMAIFFSVNGNFRSFGSTRNHFLGDSLKFSGKNFSSEVSAKANSRCWNCNAEPDRLPFLVCGLCRTIQPVDHSVDYFQIFGLDKKYDIEDENLEGKYKGWQKKLHPDLVHSKSEKEREFAAAQSARVIDAYRTLRNPMLRAIYVLKLEGVDVDEEETISEPELLAEIMEIREAVDEAPDSQALNEIQSMIREKLKHWYKSFANVFQNQKFEEAITCIRRMKYYNRVNEAILKRL